MVGDKCVKDDSGNLSFDNEAKKVAWKQHYERLLNEEFSWNPEDLTADPVLGSPIHIDVEMVVKAITKMRTDAIFILRQLQEKHLAKNKKLYFAFVDLEKAFDRVPRKVIW